MSCIIEIKPIGCVCLDSRKKLVSSICGHLHSDKCIFDCYKCTICNQLFRYWSWGAQHAQICDKQLGK
jgi:hypothetical protein